MINLRRILKPLACFYVKFKAILRSLGRRFALNLADKLQLVCILGRFASRLDGSVYRFAQFAAVFHVRWARYLQSLSRALPHGG